MKHPFRNIAVALVVLSCIAAIVVAQSRRRGYRGGSGALELIDRRGVPDWEVDGNFKKDVFTFVRIKYSSSGRWGGDWTTDWPDAELNLSFRLQQLTSLKVEPKPIVLELTDDALFDYPFVYIVEPGALEFT